MIFQKLIIGAYKKMAYTRCDDAGKAYYFSSDDFAGLKKESYSFTSSLGHNLQGYIYSYDNCDENRLIVFDHGFGGGHRSYMREIEKLASHGYAVFAYDHTGCMESGGETPNGMAQSLCDLNDCLNAIKSDARFEGKRISVVGHSWGGFSTLNIAALHSDISHAVVLSGFVSVERLVSSFFGGILKLYRKAIMTLERGSNPNFIEFDAVKTLSESNVKTLLIYSDNDMLCKKELTYDVLRGALENKSNVRFVLCENKGHNPNYTADAVKYLAEYSAQVAKLSKKKKLETPEEKARFVASFDWQRMTEQDDAVWAEIFACLDS